jgi:hypothetical protein
MIWSFALSALLLFNPALAGTDSVARAACEKTGGRWEGTVEGRGRLTGCNLKTKDAGKACKTAEDCESVCLKSGLCYGWKYYKGCAHFKNHQGIICVD